MKDVLLINPPSPSAGAYLPTGLIRLHGALKEVGFNSHILDLEEQKTLGRIPFPKGLSDILPFVLSDHPARVFALTAMNVTWPWAAMIIRVLRWRYPQASLIAGGPQITLHGKRILELTPELDIACVGEWEADFAILIKAILTGSDLKQISGLHIRDGAKIVSTAPKSTVDNLEGSIYPPTASESYCELVDILNIDAGRGCAYKCKFCSVAAISGRRPRFKSPQHLVEETRVYLSSKGMKADILVSYEHDNFLGDPGFLERFVSCKTSLGLTYSYACSVRLDLLNDHTMMLLKQSNCRVVFLGIETGSPSLQKSSGKRLQVDKVPGIVQQLMGDAAQGNFEYPAPDDLRSSCSSTQQCRVKGLNEHGIIAACNFIIGLPRETTEDLSDSIELMGKIVENGGRVGACVFCPEPGSLYGEEIPTDQWILFQNSIWLNAMLAAGMNISELDRSLHAFLYTVPNPHYDIHEAVKRTLYFVSLLDAFPQSLQMLRTERQLSWTELWSQLDKVDIGPGQDQLTPGMYLSFWQKQPISSRLATVIREELSIMPAGTSTNEVLSNAI